jgi:hypothetical protein
MMNQLKENYKNIQIFKHFHSSKIGVLRTIYAYYIQLLNLFDEKFGVDYFGEYFPRLDPDVMSYYAWKKKLLRSRKDQRMENRENILDQ